MSTLLLIDFSNTLFRSLAVNKDLSHNAESTGGLYGVVRQLTALLPKIQPVELLVCMDKKPYFRSNLYPWYKANRKVNPFLDKAAIPFTELLRQNTQSTLELFDCLQVPVQAEQGFECDDLIAFAVQKYCSTYEKIVILSNDSDLFQLLTYDNVWLWKDKSFIGQKEFKQQYQFDPSRWVDYVILVGSHNNVAGISGVGPKTATKALYEKAVWDKIATNFQDQLQLSRQLVTLPFQAPAPVMLEPKAITSNLRPVLRFIESKGINFTTQMDNAFRGM